MNAKNKKRVEAAAAAASQPQSGPLPPWAKAHEVVAGPHDGVLRSNKKGSRKAYIDFENRFGETRSVSIWSNLVPAELKPGNDCLIHIKILPATDEYPNEFVECDVCLVP
tara:strand:+ start:825 stop:1154 length:330 start_codon:yes stop_codon:yes gene_type:complete